MSGPEHPAARAVARESAGVIDAPASFNAATSDFQGKFIKALDPSATRIPMLGIYKTSTGFISSADDPDLKELIATKSPTELLEAIAKADPKMAGLMTAINADPKLAESFHKALVQDPSMLANMGKIGAGQSNIDLAQFQESLKNPGTRNIFRQVLDKIAESPDDKWNFGTLDALAGHMKSGDTAKSTALLTEMGINAGMSFGIGDLIAFIKDLVENPQMAMSNLADKLVDAGLIPPEQEAMVREQMQKFSGIAGGIANAIPTGALNTLASFSKPAATSLDGVVDTNLSAADFKTAFTEAMEGKELTEANVLKAAAKADPRFRDETLAITRSHDLSALFKNVVDVSSVEAAANSLTNIRDGLTTSASDPTLSSRTPTQRLESVLTPALTS